MGFSLESMIKELEETLSKEQKPAKIIKDLQKKLAWWKKYAKDCGQL